VKPWKVLATEGRWTLRQRDTQFMVQVDGKILSTSRQHGEEATVAHLACARLNAAAPRVLLGGLGFGYMLRALLDALPDLAKVTVAEHTAPLIAWHRGPLASLHENALEDHRVTVENKELATVLFKHRATFDVVVLDLDDSPFPSNAEDHQELFSLGGMSSLRASLRSGGRLAVSSSATHPGFNKRLREVGFTASVEKLGTGGHLVFLGDL
jgi:spermidine synthase